MPVLINGTEIMTDDGKFTDSFNPSLIGDDYKDSKAFESIPDIVSLLKAHVDTKAMVGRKMEGVIQRPDENATEEQKADYRTSLLKELGVPERAGDYVFARPEGMPEELINTDLENSAKEFLHSKNVPSDIASDIVNWYYQTQHKAIQDRLADEDKQFKEACGALDKKWTGDARVKNNRLAFKAIMLLASDELKQKLVEAKINDDVANHDKWRALGFSPEQRQVWQRMGEMVKADEAITDMGGPVEEGNVTGEQKAINKIYDHPTSKKAREARKASA